MMDKKYEIIYQRLIRKYNCELRRFESLDTKGSSLMNINILVLTIEMTLIVATVMGLFINISYFPELIERIFISLFMLNVICNSFSLYYLYQSHKSMFILCDTNEKDLLYHLFDDGNDKHYKNILGETIHILKKNLEFNEYYTNLKSKNIRKGSKLLFISEIVLIIDLNLFLGCMMVII